MLLYLLLISAADFDIQRAVRVATKSKVSSSTHLDYLTGLSWASPGQHVFFTAGGYAGNSDKTSSRLVRCRANDSPTSHSAHYEPVPLGFWLRNQLSLRVAGRRQFKEAKHPQLKQLADEP